MANPVLKWAGGKRQIVDEVIANFPRDYKSRRFHEPMFGAGAITFRIEPKKGTINDINRRLVGLYRVIQNHPKELIVQNRKHRLSKDYFDKARERFNSSCHGGRLNVLEEASLLIYLNRTCYNGLYRENSRGEFNVPFGKYKTVDFVQEDAVLKASVALRNLEIHNEDFSHILEDSEPGDLVYFDPPYHPTSATSSFTSYNRMDFGYEDQVRLRDAMIQLHENGVMVILSNSSSPEMKDLYEGLEFFYVTEIQAKRMINCNGSKRGTVGELIVTNVPPTKRVLRF